MSAIELVIEGIDRATGTLDNVSRHLGGLESAIGTVAKAAAAVGGFVAMSAALKGVVAAGMESQDALAGLQAVLRATGAANQKDADEWAAAQGKTAVAQSATNEQLADWARELKSSQAESAKLNAEMREQQQRIWEMKNVWTDAGLGVKTAEAELAIMQGRAEELTAKQAKLSAEIDKGSPKTIALAQALGLTAPVAHMAQDELLGLAASLQNVTKFDDETVMSAEAVLLRFRTIGKDVFPDATKITLDLATALGTDAASAATMLGKALVDPGEGLLRLKAAGVDFSKAETKQIQDLQAAGKTAEAQRVILEALRSSIGGLAEEAGKTASGQWARFENRLADVSETIGEKMMPAVTAVGAALFDWLGSDAIQSGIQRFALAVEDLLSGDWAGFLSGIMLAFGGTADQLGFMVPLITGVSAAWARMQQAFEGGGAAGVLNELFAGAASGAPALLDSFGSMAPVVGQAIMNWITETAPQVLNFLNSIGTVIIAWLPVFAGIWAQYGARAWGWLADTVPQLLATATQWLTALYTWQMANLPVWAQQIGQMAGPAIQWILDSLPGLMANLGTWVGFLMGWILDTAANAIGWFVPLAAQFVGWVITDVLPQLPTVLGQLTAAIMAFLISAGLELAPHIAQLAERFWKWVTDPGGPADKIGGALSEAWKNVTAWLASMQKEAAKQFEALGKSIIDGIKAGVMAALESLLNTIRNAIQAAYAAATGKADAHSPSRLFAELGRNLSAGLEVGVNEGAPRAIGATAALVPAMAAAPAMAEIPPLMAAPGITIYATINNGMDIEEVAYRVLDVYRQHRG